MKLSEIAQVIRSKNAGPRRLTLDLMFANDADSYRTRGHAYHALGHDAEDAKDLDDMVSRAGSIAFRDGFARAGQRVIIVAGVPLRAPGTTNMLRIASVGPDGDADM